MATDAQQNQYRHLGTTDEEVTTLTQFSDSETSFAGLAHSHQCVNEEALKEGQTWERDVLTMEGSLILALVGGIRKAVPVRNSLVGPRAVCD